jgi:hypothetical protein
VRIELNEFKPFLNIEFSIESLSLEGLILGILFEFLEDTKLQIEPVFTGKHLKLKKKSRKVSQNTCTFLLPQ